MIKKEFRKIPFTTPTINVQPPDHKALVNKAEYVHITFDGTGNGPGETYTTTLLGHTVTMTPQLVDITYTWGDGNTTGPTTDRGGKWPHGNITHAYPKHGTYTITVQATYTASFSIDGNTYEPTTQTATRTSTTTITVAQSYNDLVKD